MRLHIDLEFFPALHRLCNEIELVKLRYRNDLRLARAKATDGNVFRPMINVDLDELARAAAEPYPRNEA